MSAFLSPVWPAPERLRSCTTLRHGDGVSPAPFDDFNLGLRCGDDPANARENRRRLRDNFGLPAEPVWLNQVHGATVLRIREQPSADAPEPEADAVVTDRDCVVLAILTADCLPVLFCDDQSLEVGAAHAGWRGLAAGVLEATVAEMQCKPEHLMVWLGPAAGPASYEVGEDVRAAFVDRDPRAAKAFTATRPGHWLVDLPMLARRRLNAVGVRQVFGGEEDTIADSGRFFSHRRDGRTGRMATLAWLSPR
jgi:YfiH family protein